jgi:hypothetical protein
LASAFGLFAQNQAQAEHSAFSRQHSARSAFWAEGKTASWAWLDSYPEIVGQKQVQQNQSHCFFNFGNFGNYGDFGNPHEL